MIIAWIVGIVVLVLVVVAVLRWPKKKTSVNDLVATAEAVNLEVFPNGKADHEAGGRMVYEIIGGAMALDECRSVFIKAALMAHMQSNVVEHLERRYGSRLSQANRDGIAGYIALRLLALANGMGHDIRRHENGIIEFGGGFFDPKANELHLKDFD